MIDVKKGRLLITIKKESPEKFLVLLYQCLLRSKQRTINSDAIFNAPETITDLDTFIELQRELSLSLGQLDRIFPRQEKNKNDEA